MVQLLEPLNVSLEFAQSDGRGLDKVRSAFFRLEAHLFFLHTLRPLFGSL